MTEPTAPAHSYKLNKDATVAVAQDYFWGPIDSCPLGVKVQLLGKGGVAQYGQYSRKDTFWTDWAPLPKTRK